MNLCSTWFKCIVFFVLCSKTAVVYEKAFILCEIVCYLYTRVTSFFSDSLEFFHPNGENLPRSYKKEMEKFSRLVRKWRQTRAPSLG